MCQCLVLCLQSLNHRHQWLHRRSDGLGHVGTAARTVAAATRRATGGACGCERRRHWQERLKSGRPYQQRRPWVCYGQPIAADPAAQSPLGCRSALPRLAHPPTRLSRLLRWLLLVRSRRSLPGPTGPRRHDASAAPLLCLCGQDSGQYSICHRHVRRCACSRWPDQVKQASRSARTRVESADSTACLAETHAVRSPPPAYEAWSRTRTKEPGG